MRKKRKKSEQDIIIVWFLELQLGWLEERKEMLS